ncbi:MAG: hypothetical protein LJE59_08810 [Chromatiaceae bacterium]|jgi:phosphate transport system protein|nr:hypothetical protein [Chromatiaceae bacterium]
MKHYEKRLEQDEQNICSRTAAVAGLARAALKNAVHALLTGNHKLANLTVLGDGAINRETRAIDHECHRFIVRHLPSAGHLRLMSATIRAVIELERIGDYAVNISRVAARLSAPPAPRLAASVENMAEESGEMLERAIQAFIDRNAEQAKAIMVMAQQVGRLRAAALGDLTAARSELPIDDLFAMFVVFGMLERVADQAKNLCEEAVFAATGQTKAKKVYRILFLDRDNACMAPMAVAIARQNFPNSGEYESAALTPARTLDPNMVEFLGARGIDAGWMTPEKFDKVPLELAEYHVVVSLQGPISNYLQNIPFHANTVVLEWDLAPSPDEAELDYDALYRALSLKLRELMEQLRGPEAD